MQLTPPSSGRPNAGCAVCVQPLELNADGAQDATPETRYLPAPRKSAWMTIPTKLLAVCSLIFALVNPALGASFDCTKASSRIDNAICASPELSELDNKLDAVYRAALAVSTDPPGVREAQREWLRATRNYCSDEGCLLTVYKQRIAALGSTSEAQSQPTDAAAATPAAVDPPVTGQPPTEPSVAAASSGPPSEAAISSAQTATSEPTPAVTSSSAALATAKGQSIGRGAETSLGPPAEPETKADGASTFKVVALVGLIVWIAVAVFAKKRGWSKVIGIGGGFIAACIALAIAGMVLMPTPSVIDATTPPRATVGRHADAPIQVQAPVVSAPRSAARPSLKSLFDTSIPQSKREELARDFVAGQYHFADRSLADMPSVTNYTFGADGTYTSSHCTAYGEVSERTFEPGSGRWSIREDRYANTGMIYYGIWIDDIPRPSLLLDRDDGLQFNFSRSRVKMLPGNTTKCE